MFKNECMYQLMYTFRSYKYIVLYLQSLIHIWKPLPVMACVALEPEL